VAADFVIKAGDTLPVLPVQLQNPDGTLPNLTGATVNFKMTDPDSKVKLIDRTAVIVDPVNALVNFPWAGGDTSVTPKIYEGEFRVVFANSSVGTFPNQGFLGIGIEQSL